MTGFLRTNAKDDTHLDIVGVHSVVSRDIRQPGIDIALFGNMIDSKEQVGQWTVGIQSNPFVSGDAYNVFIYMGSAKTNSVGVGSFARSSATMSLSEARELMGMVRAEIRRAEEYRTSKDHRLAIQSVLEGY